MRTLKWGPRIERFTGPWQISLSQAYTKRSFTKLIGLTQDQTKSHDLKQEERGVISHADFD